MAELHAAWLAADGRGAADGRHRHRRRQPASGTGLRRERHAAEQNFYLLDGAQNINRMDSGYALKIPVDAVAEFRILTQERARRIRRTYRSDDEHRDAVGNEPDERESV